MVSLTILDQAPPELLECGAQDTHKVLGGPTLIELSGDRAKPLFVSALLHGNETSGLQAIQALLRSRTGKRLPRSLMILIGNTAAASQGLRRLDGQPDFNRIWPGAEDDLETPEARVMAEVHRRVVEREAFAAIDLHNNTGRNPHYGVVCTQEPPVLALAAMFAPRAVRFRGLPGTQTASFTDLVPAMTAECGQPGVSANAKAAADFVGTVLDLSSLPPGPSADRELDLFHTLGVIRLKRDVSIGSDAGRDALCLEPDLDTLNFERLKPGTRFGHTAHPMPIEVIDEQGRDVAECFFEVEGGELRLRRDGVPAMLTTDATVIRQDCLGYLMERLAP